MIWIRYFLVTICLLQALTAEAYVPRARIILDKTAKNDGRGFYQVEQEVQLQADPETVTLRESWIIQDGETLRCSVRVVGGGSSSSKPLALIYKSGMRYAVDAGGSIRSTKLSQDFAEAFFHFRSADGLGRYLTSLNMVSPQALSERKVTSLKTLKLESDPYVSLARLQNSIAFVLGSTAAGPSVWIDQEKFVLRKLKLPSGAEIVADNHEQFAKGLLYPKDRMISWNDKSVQIKTLAVKSLSDAQAQGKFNPQTLKAEEKLSGQMPEAPLVREFYSRFR